MSQGNGSIHTTSNNPFGADQFRRTLNRRFIEMTDQGQNRFLAMLAPDETPDFSINADKIREREAYGPGAAQPITEFAGSHVQLEFHDGYIQERAPREYGATMLMSRRMYNRVQAIDKDLIRQAINAVTQSITLNRLRQMFGILNEGSIGNLIKCPDGKPLFSATHTRKGFEDRPYTNLNAAALTGATVVQSMVSWMDQNDHNNDPMDVLSEGDSMKVYANAGQAIELERLFRSLGNPDTPNNEINRLSLFKYTVVICNWLRRVDNQNPIIFQRDRPTQGNTSDIKPLLRTINFVGQGPIKAVFQAHEIKTIAQGGMILSAYDDYCHATGNPLTMFGMNYYAA